MFSCDEVAQRYSVFRPPLAPTDFVPEGDGESSRDELQQPCRVIRQNPTAICVSRQRPTTQDGRSASLLLVAFHDGVICAFNELDEGCQGRLLVRTRLPAVMKLFYCNGTDSVVTMERTSMSGDGPAHIRVYPSCGVSEYSAEESGSKEEKGADTKPHSCHTLLKMKGNPRLVAMCPQSSVLVSASGRELYFFDLGREGSMTSPFMKIFLPYEPKILELAFPLLAVHFNSGVEVLAIEPYDAEEEEIPRYVFDAVIFTFPEHSRLVDGDQRYRLLRVLKSKYPADAGVHTLQFLPVGNVVFPEEMVAPFTVMSAMLSAIGYSVTGEELLSEDSLKKPFPFLNARGDPDNQSGGEDSARASVAMAYSRSSIAIGSSGRGGVGSRSPSVSSTSSLTPPPRRYTTASRQPTVFRNYSFDVGASAAESTVALGARGREVGADLRRNEATTHESVGRRKEDESEESVLENLRFLVSARDTSTVYNISIPVYLQPALSSEEQQEKNGRIRRERLRQRQSDPLGIDAQQDNEIETAVNTAAVFDLEGISVAPLSRMEHREGCMQAMMTEDIIYALTPRCLEAWLNAAATGLGSALPFAAAVVACGDEVAADEGKKIGFGIKDSNSDMHSQDKQSRTGRPSRQRMRTAISASAVAASLGSPSPSVKATLRTSKNTTNSDRLGAGLVPLHSAFSSSSPSSSALSAWRMAPFFLSSLPCQDCFMDGIAADGSIAALLLPFSGREGTNATPGIRIFRLKDGEALHKLMMSKATTPSLRHRGMSTGRGVDSNFDAFSFNKDESSIFEEASVGTTSKNEEQRQRLQYFAQLSMAQRHRLAKVLLKRTPGDEALQSLKMMAECAYRSGLIAATMDNSPLAAACFSVARRTTTAMFREIEQLGSESLKAEYLERVLFCRLRYWHPFAHLLLDRDGEAVDSSESKESENEKTEPTGEGGLSYSFPFEVIESAISHEVVTAYALQTFERLGELVVLHLSRFYAEKALLLCGEDSRQLRTGRKKVGLGLAATKEAETCSKLFGLPLLPRLSFDPDVALAAVEEALLQQTQRGSSGLDMIEEQDAESVDPGLTRDEGSRIARRPRDKNAKQKAPRANRGYGGAKSSLVMPSVVQEGRALELPGVTEKGALTEALFAYAVLLLAVGNSTGGDILGRFSFGLLTEVAASYPSLICADLILQRQGLSSSRDGPEATASSKRKLSWRPAPGLLDILLDRFPITAVEVLWRLRDELEPSLVDEAFERAIERSSAVPLSSLQLRTQEKNAEGEASQAENQPSSQTTSSVSGTHTRSWLRVRHLIVLHGLLFERWRADLQSRGERAKTANLDEDDVKKLMRSVEQTTDDKNERTADSDALITQGGVEALSQILARRYIWSMQLLLSKRDAAFVTDELSSFLAVSLAQPRQTSPSTSIHYVDPRSEETSGQSPFFSKALREWNAFFVLTSSDLPPWLEKKVHKEFGAKQVWMTRYFHGRAGDAESDIVLWKANWTTQALKRHIFEKLWQLIFEVDLDFEDLEKEALRCHDLPRPLSIALHSAIVAGMGHYGIAVALAADTDPQQAVHFARDLCGNNPLRWRPLFEKLWQLVSSGTGTSSERLSRSVDEGESLFEEGAVLARSPVTSSRSPPSSPQVPLGTLKRQTTAVSYQKLSLSPSWEVFLSAVETACGCLNIKEMLSVLPRDVPAEPLLPLLRRCPLPP